MDCESKDLVEECENGYFLLAMYFRGRDFSVRQAHALLKSNLCPFSTTLLLHILEEAGLLARVKQGRYIAESMPKNDPASQRRYMQRHIQLRRTVFDIEEFVIRDG